MCLSAAALPPKHNKITQIAAVSTEMQQPVSSQRHCSTVFPDTHSLIHSEGTSAPYTISGQPILSPAWVTALGPPPPSWRRAAIGSGGPSIKRRNPSRYFPSLKLTGVTMALCAADEEVEAEWEEETTAWQGEAPLMIPVQRGRMVEQVSVRRPDWTMCGDA